MNRLEYDKFGQRVYMHLGTATETLYTYDHLSRKLISLKTKDGSIKHFLTRM
ncbi:MAG: hypothetical protein OEV44_01205 [Spirochaetota bacterium]|nr:hypothetical protein [Spirochaetota bacterium]